MACSVCVATAREQAVMDIAGKSCCEARSWLARENEHPIRGLLTNGSASSSLPQCDMWEVLIDHTCWAVPSQVYLHCSSPNTQFQYTSQSLSPYMEWLSGPEWYSQCCWTCDLVIEVEICCEHYDQPNISYVYDLQT